MLEILDKKDSSAGAVLKGTAGHNMWARGKLLSGTPAMTSHHVTMKARHQSGERIVFRLPNETSQALIVGLVGKG